MSVETFTTATSVDEAIAALAEGARPVAGGTDLVVGARQGKAPLPGAARRDPPDRRAARDRRGRRRRPPRRARHARRDRRAPRDPRTADRARRRVGDRRLPRDAQPRDDRRQRDERLTRDGDRRPADLLRRHRDAPLRRRAPAGWRSRSSSPDRVARPPSRTSCSSRSTSRSRPPARAAATCGSSTAARWRSRSSARPPSSRSRTAGVATPASRSRRSPRRSAASRPRRRRSIGSDGGAEAVAQRPRRSGSRGHADLRRPRLRALPPRDGRGDRPPRDRRRARPRPRRRRARSPPARPAWRPLVKVPVTLTVNDVAYPVELEPGHEPARRGPRRRRPDRDEGGLRRLRVRRVHDAARRPAGEQLLVPRAAGRGVGDHDGRRPRRRRRAEPAPGGLPRARRRPVRLLHARDARLRDRAARATTRTRPRTRCASASPATSAAAPATTASSRPCSPCPARHESAEADSCAGIPESAFGRREADP